MSNLPGRVTDEELGLSDDGTTAVRNVTVAVPAHQFHEPGGQFESGEKVVIVTEPVEKAIEDAREGDDG